MDDKSFQLLRKGMRMPVMRQRILKGGYFVRIDKGCLECLRNLDENYMISMALGY